ncbi:MAG TPA: extensin family protein [Pseudolabrys sp.]
MPDTAAMGRLIAILWLIIAGSGMAAAENVPLPRPRPIMPPAWSEPHSFREAAGPDFNSAEVTAKPSDCDLRLGKIAVIAPMPRLIGPGACGGGDMVRVDAVLLADNKRIDIKPAPYLRCAMAEQLASWVRDEAAPRVASAGVALRSVETYDDFECRGRNRIIGAKLSEHGKGNAVDVRAFTLADSRVIGLTDMTAAKDLRDDLRKSACARFTTVLGPGSDGYHEAHIHLDLAERHNGYRICQWDVRVPPPPKPEIAGAQIDGKPVPLPTPRPAMPAAAVKQKL